MNIIDVIVRKYRGPIGPSFCRNSWIQVKIGRTSFRTSKFAFVFLSENVIFRRRNRSSVAISSWIFLEGNGRSDQRVLPSVPKFGCKNFAVSKIWHCCAWLVLALVDQSRLGWPWALLEKELDLWRSISYLLQSHQYPMTTAMSLGSLHCVFHVKSTVRKQERSFLSQKSRIILFITFGPSLLIEITCLELMLTVERNAFISLQNRSLLNKVGGLYLFSSALRISFRSISMKKCVRYSTRTWCNSEQKYIACMHLLGLSLIHISEPTRLESKSSFR